MALFPLVQSTNWASVKMHRRDLLKTAGSALLVGTESTRAGAGTEHVFPAGFTWGVSSAAIQIEGSLHADGRGPSIWDDVQGGKAHFLPEPAADHYHRWRDDIRLLQQLGISGYRFSVAWPRVLPTGAGPVNSVGLGFYDELTDALLSAGVQPWVCLHHWDMPVEIQEKGGWIVRETVDRFLDYARIVMDRLGDRVRHWIPLNEPNTVAYSGYGAGVWPPKFMNEEFFYDAVHHQNLAMGRLWKELRREGWLVGPTLALDPIRPASTDTRDVAAANLQTTVTQDAFLDPLLLGHYPSSLTERIAPLVHATDLDTIHNSIDFIGINYYGPKYRQAWVGAPFSNDGRAVQLEALPQTDASHIVIEPSGLSHLLKNLRDRYENPPVIVTENGAAFRDGKDQQGEVHDQQRIEYLRSHLQAVHQALALGCDVRGYFVWTLLDSWEWTDGYDTRYGLVYVDPDTQKRTAKSSFDWYSSVIRSGKVQD